MSRYACTTCIYTRCIYRIWLLDSLSRVFCFVCSWVSNGNSFSSLSRHFPFFSTWIFLLDFLKVCSSKSIAERESLIAESAAAILKLFTRQPTRKTSRSFTGIVMKWQHVIRFSVVYHCHKSLNHLIYYKELMLSSNLS